MLLVGVSGGAETAAPVLAPGWEPLRHPAPEPGTYELPPLGDAADGRVLDVTGRPRRLHEFLGDRIVVLSFIYTRCPDVNACPLATYALTRVRDRVLREEDLRDRVRLVTLSFDPTHDTPEAMAEWSGHVAQGGEAWEFLTTESTESLAPILRAYGQVVQPESGTISHVLRVHLIDHARRIRNVYTTSFLHPDTLLSDVRTLLASNGDAAPRPSARPETSRVDLVRVHREPPLGLPEIGAPPDDPVTAAKVALGRRLFFDRRLSRNDTISCAMCHVPRQGFTSNEMATAVGIEGRTVRRNAPTLYNVAYMRRLFHDGRESRLEQQVWGPLLAANEMGNPSVGFVLDELRARPEYTKLFAAAFDGRGPTMETVGRALASYQRTLLSGNSAFDRWRFGGERAALTERAVRGFRLFTGRARCATCHTIADDHALFTDQAFHDTGIGWRQSMEGDAGAGVEPDLGRYEITGSPEDRWRFRTPSLRNVALTAPYMHDGSLGSLRAVVEFYDAGAALHPTLDPALAPLGLEERDVDDLVAFLESLTGGDVEAIVANALAAPVGDPR